MVGKMPHPELRRMIAYGKRYTFTFDYDGKPLKLRPLSSMEIDDATYKSLNGVDPKVAGYILKRRLNLHDKVEIDLDKEVPEWMYKGYLRHINEFSYWIVYHALKDFYPDTTIEAVREMKYVHAIATAVIVASAPSSKREIVRYVLSKDGKELGELVFRYHQPLANVADLTPLQEEFLFYADPEHETKPVISKFEIEKIFPELIDEDESES